MNPSNGLRLEIVTPEEKILEAEASMVVIPGVEGCAGILPQHAPMVIELGLGVVDIFTDGRIQERVYVNGGFADVSGEVCTLLVEKAIFLKDVKTDQLAASIENLENVVRNSTVDTVRETAQIKLLESKIIRAALDNGPVVETHS